MYFSEQRNVDDDATLITIFLVSFNLQSCCLMQSAVCSLQSANVIHRSAFDHTEVFMAVGGWQMLTRSTSIIFGPFDL